jgi:hypothetical protein
MFDVAVIPMDRIASIAPVVTAEQDGFHEKVHDLLQG